MKLPLLYKTPARWVTEVLKEPLAFLSDHAYLEKKPASNALLLINRWPEPKHPQEWVSTLARIARDEALHLDQVSGLLRKRGGKLQRSHRNPYATDLHVLVRKGLGPREIMDHLLVSALIEARSCERFYLLSKHAKDKELARFYRGLSVSEMGHYAIFLKLAFHTAPQEEVKKRWKAMLEAEAKIMKRQPMGPRMHSGVPSLN